MNTTNECDVTAYDGCSLPCYNDHNECVLHCSKEAILKDHYLQFSDLLRDFRKAFIEHTVELIFKRQKESHNINKKSVKKYFEKDLGADVDVEAIEHHLKKQTIVYSFVAFPTRDERDPHLDYLDILQCIGHIHFNYCKFYVNHLKLDKNECFFQDCEFYDNWYLKDIVPFENVNDVVYQMCIFHKSVSASGREVKNERFVLNHTQFCDCSFNDELVFEYVDMKMPLFNNDDNMEFKIGFLKVYHCEVEDRFLLNKHRIESVYMEKTNFKGKLEFKENCIKSFKAIDCNYSKLTDFYKSQFQIFSISKSIFDDFVGFERAIFGDRNKINDAGNIASFTFATFLNIVNFRYAEFLSGIDIEHANFTDETNFKNVKIEEENTSRESYRIIKHSFDKIGNFIDGNKYYALEMQKYKDELKSKKGHWQEKLVFWFNDKVSNFGQSYVRPFFIFLGLVGIHYSLFLIQEQRLMSQNFSKLYDFILPTVQLLNSLAKMMLPFKKFLTTGMEFTSLIFYILYLLMIWQMIITVKRHTKR